jgi:hypothetical protein
MATAARWTTETKRPDRHRQLRAVVKELQRRQPPSELHAKQRCAFQSQASEILYGGAAGGGKSHLMRRAAIAWCKWIPGLQVYIFRREFADLFKNHMEGSAGFPVLLAGEVERREAKIIWSKNQIRFRNGPKGTYEGGSVIHLCHCQHEKDVYGYQGAEIHVLMIDELTQWTRKMYLFLRGRVRLGGLKVPAWLKGLFPRILTGANPGGIGHNWVKADFISIARPLDVVEMAKSEGGMRRQYIPALLEDNPSLTENDPDYEHRLEGLGDPALVRAMRLGDWDIVSGGMFDDLWKLDVHAIPAFPIPASWRIDRSFDWGESAPFSVGWWAESDGTPAILADGKQWTFPKGSLFRIAEWYGWDGKNPNVGLKLTNDAIARGIVEREKEAPWGARVKPGPADSMIFNVDAEKKSIAGTMKAAGVTWTEADKSSGTRVNGWSAIRRMLKAARDGNMEQAQLFAFDHCLQFIRTVPVLPRKETNREDVDSAAEDHIGDETRYRVLAEKRQASTGRFKIG